MKKVYEWSDELRQYMKDNDITEPETKQREQAKTQGASQEEIDAIFE